jgi:hypothetical protein
MPKSRPKTKPAKPATTKKTTRQLDLPRYKSFRLSKKIRQPKPPITGSFRLFYRSLKIMRHGWKLFGWVVLVYMILSIVLVKGLNVTVGVSQLQEVLAQVFEGSGAQLATSLTIFGILLGNTNAAVNDAASVYQGILLVVVSLASIWALRNWPAPKGKTAPSAKDAFYKGMYPLIPFLLVLLVIGIQLLPVSLANFIFGLVFGAGLVAGPLEQFLWLGLIMLLALSSLYLVSSSVFALYIVTLPDVRPIQALKSATQLVKHRRLSVILRLMFLPVIMLIIAAVIILPMIVVYAPAAELIFIVLAALALPVAHAYIYNLYRELL